MANAKSLIIIKPMSAQLQKLYEVLLNVSGEENIEIFATDNLGEIAQLYAMGGQHLTLFSDPKICALFLQQNRTYNHAKHSKSLLLTPKTLPPKIMDKFIKLGLTENILDTAPPKTLLYKVKLLLKSIKSNDKLEDKVEKQEQVVKSMMDLSEPEANAKAEIHHSTEQGAADTKSSLAEDLKKKKIELELEQGLDYLKEAKKKKTYQEDSIQTNWTSKKSSSETSMEFDEANPEESKKKDSSNDELDGYFRSKETKKINLDLVEAENTEVKRKSAESDETEEETNKTKIRKPQTEIELTIDTPKPKNTNSVNEEEGNGFSRVKSLKDTQIEMQEAEKDPKGASVQFAEEGDESPYKRKKEQLELELEASKKEKRAKSEENENTSGNLTGKIKSSKSTELDLEESESEEKENKIYEKTEEEDLKRRSLELELELTKKEKNKKSTDEDNQNQDPNFKQRNINETELDLTDKDGMKKKSAEQAAEDTEDNKAKKKSANIEIEFSEDSESSKKIYERDEEELKNKKSKDLNDLLDGTGDKDKDKDKNTNGEEDTNGEFNRKKVASLQGDFEESEKNRDKTDTEKKEEERKKRQVHNELDLAQSDTKDEKAKELNHEREENLKAKRKTTTELDIEAGKKQRNAGVEQIDNYMRSGGKKAGDQDWSQNKKAQEISFSLTSTSQAQIDIQRAARKEAGEITIDYRMLKDEFNELAKSGYKAPTEEDKLKKQEYSDEDEESSFKVLELKANGFDYAINIINQYYTPEIKAPVLYKNIAQKLLSEEKAYCVFYTYQNFSKEHKESFSSFKEFQPAPLEYWEELKKEQSNLDYLFEKTMSAWMCREIKDKDSFWVDTELPSWAPQELTNKVVEHVYPYYDGLDRMGMAYLYFPEGINPQSEKKILVLLELLRGVFLETIQRNSASSENGDESETQTENDKTGKVLGFIGNLFGKKKTG